MGQVFEFFDLTFGNYLKSSQYHRKKVNLLIK